MHGPRSAFGRGPSAKPRFNVFFILMRVWKYILVAIVGKRSDQEAGCTFPPLVGGSTFKSICGTEQ